MSRVITQQNLEIINDIKEKLKPDFELLEKYSRNKTPEDYSKYVQYIATRDGVIKILGKEDT